MRRFWPRAFVHADMNCFFAAVEQLDVPELVGAPVAVTNGLTGTCVITSSYQARACGVTTGMHIKKARQLCPDIVQRPARPKRYAEISARIMHELTAISPDVEIFSVDEAYVDITRMQKMYGHPIDIARKIKSRIYEVSGLKCSVGVSEGKLTAKWAAKQNKPDGFTVLKPEDTKQTLAPVNVTDICGIARGISEHLEHHGATTCGQVALMPMTVLSKRWSNIGKRLWLVCNGHDPAVIETTIPDPKTVGHGKVMPPNTQDRDVILMYLQHMSQKVGTRLRKHNLVASKFSVGLRTVWQWLADDYHINFTNDDKDIYALCQRLVQNKWNNHGVFQVQINALNPVPAGQIDLFNPPKEKRIQLNNIKDRINQKYGEFSLAPATLLGRSDMPNVISPAWKPFGHRETLQAGGYDVRENSNDSDISRILRALPRIG